MAEPQLCDVSVVLPPYLRRVFPFQTFNHMQSQCLEAWNSDANLLVSAPTGSGKTVCFELAILRHLHKTLESTQSTHLDSKGLSSKAVFIAPTKALCAEKEHQWKTRFHFTGLRVEAITGDVTPALSDSKLNNTDLILTTAEKWDSITRNIGSHSAVDFVGQVSLLLLDEVHQIGDSRGATLESVVTRMLVSNDEFNNPPSSSPANHLRVIAVSATIGNTDDVAEWLRVAHDHIKVFDASYRPVSLEFKILGYYIRNQWQASKVYDSRLMQVILDLGDRKPTLVFCPSRRQTAISAAALVESLKKSSRTSVEGVNPLTRALTVEKRRRLSDIASTCRDKVLADLLPSGVAIHNAEMNPRSRQLVESLFRESLIQCLFSTSTLAQGVNLPARLVVIAGTSVYHNGELREYDRNMLMQMCGRAGRTGLDTKGVVAIMTSKATTRFYQNIERARPSFIESKLASGIEECLNAEIARQFVTDIPTAVAFLSKTFFWVRQRKKFGVGGSTDADRMASQATTVTLRTIRQLADCKLLFYDEDHFGVGSTLAGRLMAKHVLSFPTMRHLMQETPNASSPFQVLKVIASCSDVLENVVIRRSERKNLNEWKENLRLNVRGKVKDPEDKVIILLQMIMADSLESTRVDFALRNEAYRMLQSATRICSCLMALVMDKGIKLPYESLFSVLQVCRALPNRTFWDGATVLRQVPGLISAHVRKLTKKGVSTIPFLASTDRARIDGIIGAKIPVGDKILSHLKQFPKFHVQTHVHRDGSGRNGIQRIDIHVNVCAQIGNWAPKVRRGERGFVLVGSHARGLIDIRVFAMADSEHHFTFEIPRERDPRRRKWIDVHVGSDRIVGVDEKDVVNCDGRHDANNDSERRWTNQKPLMQNPKLSVADGRISKRFVQTTVPQALTRGFVRLKTSRPESSVSFGRSKKASAERIELQPVLLPKEEEPVQTGSSVDLPTYSLPQREVISKDADSTRTSRREVDGYSTHAMVTKSVAVSGKGLRSASAVAECGSTLGSNVNSDSGALNAEQSQPPAPQSLAREYDETFRNLF